MLSNHETYCTHQSQPCWAVIGGTVLMGNSGVLNSWHSSAASPLCILSLIHIAIFYWFAQSKQGHVRKRMRVWGVDILCVYTRVGAVGWEHDVFIHARYTSSLYSVRACEDSNTRRVGWAEVHMFPRCLFVRWVRYRRFAQAASAIPPPGPFLFRGCAQSSLLTSLTDKFACINAWTQTSSLKEAFWKINTGFQDAKSSTVLQVFCVNFSFNLTQWRPIT